MPEYVRVKQAETGHEISITRERAKALGLEALDKDAVDSTGAPLPPQYKTTVAKAAAKKTAKKTASSTPTTTSTKEN